MIEPSWACAISIAAHEAEFHSARRIRRAIKTVADSMSAEQPDVVREEAHLPARRGTTPGNVAVLRSSPDAAYRICHDSQKKGGQECGGAAGKTTPSGQTVSGNIALTRHSMQINRSEWNLRPRPSKIQASRFNPLARGAKDNAEFDRLNGCQDGRQYEGEDW